MISKFRVRHAMALAFLWPLFAHAQPTAPMRITNATNLASLRALPPTAKVQLPSGRQIDASRFNSQVDMLRRAQQRSVSRGGVDLSIRPAQGAATMKITNAAGLAAALARPNSDVVELPNGAKLSVGDLRKLGALAQREKGRNPLDAAKVNVSAAARASAIAPIKVRNRQDLIALKGKPDATVVEAPNGARITLGDIRAASRNKR